MSKIHTRRNCCKAREVTDHAMLALHKYYLRAAYLHEAHMAEYHAFVAKNGEAAWKITGMSEEVVKARMYLDLWWSTLYVVVEGYNKLGRNYPQTEAVLDPKDGVKAAELPARHVSLHRKILRPGQVRPSYARGDEMGQRSSHRDRIAAERRRRRTNGGSYQAAGLG